MVITVIITSDGDKNKTEKKEMKKMETKNESKTERIFEVFVELSDVQMYIRAPNAAVAQAIAWKIAKDRGFDACGSCVSNEPVTVAESEVENKGVD